MGTRVLKSILFEKLITTEGAYKVQISLNWNKKVYGNCDPVAPEIKKIENWKL